MQLTHLAARLYDTPLLIARAKLDAILAVLGPRIGLHELPTLDAALPGPRNLAPAPSGIALIPIHGTLVRRALGVEAASGLTSYAEISLRLDAALADLAIQGIVLDIDSPGGEAGGAFDLAARIRQAGCVKPIWAHANDAACSAAYALASAAERLTLSQTAGVGSIGVIALHVDQSARDAQEGLTYTAIYAGAHKNDYSPHAPLSADAAAALQTEVDRLYAIFVGQVAAMRGLEPEAVRALEARLMFGEDAVQAGLADAVMPLPQLLAEFTHSLSARQRLAAGASARPPPARASPGGDATPLPLCSSPFKETPMDTTEPLAAEAVAAVAPPAAIPADPPTAQPQADPRAEAQAIAELCLIAGMPGRTAGFLAAGLNEAQVRTALLQARAEQPEIVSRIDADAGTQTRPEAGPMVAAVKKLIHQE